MISRVQQVVRRREALVAQAQLQREHVAAEALLLRESLWFVELGTRAVRYVRARPLIALTAVAAIALLGPRRLLGGGYRAALLTLSLLQLGSSLAKLRSRDDIA